MPKFLLIDHSIIKTGGHYLEYAQNVLSAVKSEDYDVFLATNKAFKQKSCLDNSYKILSLYKYDVWGKKAEDTQCDESYIKNCIIFLKQFFKKIIGKSAYKIKFSSIGYAIKGLGTKDFSFNKKNAFENFKLCIISLIGLVVCIPIFTVFIIIKVIKGILRLIKKLIKNIAYLCGISSGQLHKLKVLMYYPINNYKSVYRTLRNPSVLAVFKKATESALNKSRIKEGDIIFIPTLSLTDLQAVQQVILKKHNARKCTWHIVLRRNLFTGREPEYAFQLYEMSEIRSIFKTFSNINNVYFYTDTEELTKQYNRISPIKFQTLPIPINPEFTEVNTNNDMTPIKVVYAGDARSEKGYQFIPNIVEKLYKKYLLEEKICFELQSNFTFKSKKDDIDVVIAREELEKYEGKGVILHKEPLTSQDYCSMIKNSQIGLLLYDRDNYYARSSGALVECLAAGIPIVIPSGSWLSSQIESEINIYQLSLKKEVETIQSYDYKNLDFIDPTNKKKTYKLKERTMVVGTKENSLSTMLSIDKNADSVYVEFKLSDFVTDGVYVRINVEFYNEFYQTIFSRSQDYKKYDRDDIKAAIFRVPDEADKVKISFYCPFSQVTAICEDLNIRLCIGMMNRPTHCLGICYSNIEDVSSDIVEICNFYKHYLKSAKEFSTKWNINHNSVQLLKSIEKNA